MILGLLVTILVMKPQYRATSLLYDSNVIAGQTLQSGTNINEVMPTQIDSDDQLLYLMKYQSIYQLIEQLNKLTGTMSISTDELALRFNNSSLAKELNANHAYTLSVEKVDRTNMFRIVVTSGDPSSATQVANAFSEIYRQERDNIFQKDSQKQSVLERLMDQVTLMVEATEHKLNNFNLTLLHIPLK